MKEDYQIILVNRKTREKKVLETIYGTIYDADNKMCEPFEKGDYDIKEYFAYLQKID